MVSATSMNFELWPLVILSMQIDLSNKNLKISNQQIIQRDQMWTAVTGISLGTDDAPAAGNGQRSLAVIKPHTFPQLFYKLSYLATLLTEVLELSTFFIQPFLAHLYKISPNSLQFSSPDVNFVTDIRFQFFPSAWVWFVHSIFQSTPEREIAGGHVGRT